MDRQTVEKGILEILDDILCPDEPITRDTRMVDELGISSMESLSMLDRIEEMFGLSIPARELRSVETFGDLGDMVMRYVEG